MGFADGAAQYPSGPRGVRLDRFAALPHERPPEGFAE